MEVEMKKPKTLKLWKFNRIAGYWVIQREVTPETKDQWLEIFKADAPAEHFVISPKVPSFDPTKGKSK